MTDLKSNIEHANQWMKQSVSLKFGIICILTLILLIPSSMINSIIYERERMHQQTVDEVSGDWAYHQVVTGPILTVPITYHQGTERYLHILPQQLNINGDLDPMTLKRGIYEVVVYESSLKLSGSFNWQVNIDSSKIKEIKWDKAFLTMGLSDLSGVKDQLIITWDGQRYEFEPSSRIPKIIDTGVTVNLPVKSQDVINFQMDLNIQGSNGLTMIPVGNTTIVDLKSKWTEPSFQGNFLPDNRNITDTGFTANWKVLQLNRNYPNSWVGNEQAHNLQRSGFGVNLMLPLDNYQKNTRMAKYAVMIIALTFLVFFLVEVMNGKRIHPFQYTLIGLALCLFYILLLSISEHVNFEIAYVIAVLSIVLLITGYARALFKSPRLTAVLSFTLCCSYGFLFVILQLADFALLIGSIGLFLILAATMYFTRNVNWYNIQRVKSGV